MHYIRHTCPLDLVIDAMLTATRTDQLSGRRRFVLFAGGLDVRGRVGILLRMNRRITGLGCRASNRLELRLISFSRGRGFETRGTSVWLRLKQTLMPSISARQP